MLIMFGVSWPVSLYKSYRARTAAGKSLIFLICIEIGYISGIANKILFNYNWVLWLYVLNFLMVAADMVMYFRNHRLDKLAAQSR